MLQATSSSGDAAPRDGERGLASVVVMPRDRFSTVQASLDSIHAHTRRPFELIVVDGGSPPFVRQYLETEAASKGFRLIHTAGFVGANTARNLGLRAARGRYVVFIENDVVVSPGWLEAMVRCAEETGADIVGPVVLIGEPEREVIHIAGGNVRIVAEGGRADVIESHFHKSRRLSEIRPLLRRQACGMIEFHCMLVRRAVFDRLGALDESLTMLTEYIDLCLAVAQFKGSIYFEPDSVVSYVAGRDLVMADLPYFEWRRDDHWAERTLRHFAEKWRLPEDCRFVRKKLEWLARHRSRLTLAREQSGTQSARSNSLDGGAALGAWLDSDALDESQKRPLREAWAEARRVYGGRSRDDGRLWTEHLAGTAALLLDNGASPDLGAAAMLRLIYTQNAASEQPRHVEPDERARIARSIGAKAERLIDRFARFNWRPDRVDALGANFDRLTSVSAHVLLIRLASELEARRHGARLGAHHSCGVLGGPWSPLLKRVAVALHANAMAAELTA